MSTSILQKAYDSTLFSRDGEDTVALLSQMLEASLSQSKEKVTQWIAPDEELAFWKNFDTQEYSTKDFFAKVIERSIHTHHPKYIGHQVAPTAPVSALATLISAQLNNGMAIYEMGQASTAIEKVVIQKFTDAMAGKTEMVFLPLEAHLLI